MRSLVSVALTVAAVLPVVVLLAFDLAANHVARKARLDAALSDQARLIDTTLAATLSEHQAILRSLASLPEVRNGFSDPEIRPWLQVLKGEHLAFVSALAARADGRVLAVNPEVDAAGVHEFWRGMSVADRDYLQYPIRSGESYVSVGFRGRGVGTAAIIALSTPVLEGARVLGILQGAIELDTLARAIAAQPGRDPRLAVLVLDRSGQVLVAESAFGLQPLRLATEHPALAAPDSLQQWTSAQAGPQLALTVEALDGGRLVVSAGTQPLARALLQDLAWALVIAALLLGSALLLAPLLARAITAPLNQLVRRMRGDQQETDLPGSAVHIRELVEAERAYIELQRAQAESTAQLRATLQRQTELFQRLEDTVRNQEAAIQARTAELQQALAALKDESLTDSLTGLSNYRHYWRSLPKLWDQAMASRQALAVIALDIDHFKRFNDSYGHQAGDQCLRRVAAALQSVFSGRAELLARTGGEEFIIVLRGHTPHAARNLAERARNTVQALGIAHAGNPGPGVVTISLGVCACVPDPAGSVDELVRRADELLYASKTSGRNRTTSEELRRG